MKHNEIKTESKKVFLKISHRVFIIVQLLSDPISDMYIWLYSSIIIILNNTSKLSPRCLSRSIYKCLVGVFSSIPIPYLIRQLVRSLSCSALSVLAVVLFLEFHFESFCSRRMCSIFKILLKKKKSAKKRTQTNDTPLTPTILIFFVCYCSQLQQQQWHIQHHKYSERNPKTAQTQNLVYGVKHTFK